MMKRGKKYRAAVELVEKGKIYELEEAVALVKKTSTTKFDATVDASFRLNVDPRQADQQIRGTLVLPHGTGKTKVVLAITQRVDDALSHGADFAGGKEMLDKIKNENWFGFDVIVATPDMMGELGKMGRILGPKGLMPNPKLGTVTTDLAKAIHEIKAGKVEYRVDRNANMHVSIGKVSFDDEKLIENLNALCERVVRVRPASVKGTYIKNAVLSTTMGPAVPFTFKGR
ncbi:MAG: 50S ribosomal protein L1 [Erysipelotrichaceae bacterium]|nr:50S ribosomal protein L1 [Bacillota bacterium]MDY0117963.1 50S ribosomal protein L1 [Bacilli bacterium]NLJ32684.1 50S ribosomal protein L1 [Erysipelotrichaceae bacterium]